MEEDKGMTITKENFLDRYGFAQLANSSDRLETEAMRSMYNSFHPGDSFINNAVDMAEIAKDTLQRKKAYDQAKKEYDESPKESRGEFKLKDPGMPDRYVTSALISLRDSEGIYTKKRNDMIATMSATEMLSYNSNQSGEPIIEIPDNIEKILKGSKTPLKDVEDKEEQGILYTAIKAIDGYKIHGMLNAQVESEMAERQLRIMSKGLEGKANKK